MSLSQSRTFECSRQDCTEQYEHAVGGSFCSERCHYRHRGTKALNIARHDHRICGTCLRWLKEVDETPEKVFSGGDYHVHHKNGIPWDNRPENLELLPFQEHMAEHRDYTTEELFEWIDSYVLEFGMLPNSTDLIGWPGPSNSSYMYRFGTWGNAMDAYREWAAENGY